MSCQLINQVDTIFSLLGFAVTINSSILILAGATFFYNPNATGEPDIPGAFELMKTFIGNGAAIVFAIALLCVSVARPAYTPHLREA